jgi:predicted CoA-binding protein
MTFEQDIFISYAHIDNQPLAKGLDGWVETLHERLKIILTQLAGEEVAVWRDRKLQGNDVFADTLTGQLSKVRLLVSVLSPRYVKSEWCLRELDEFCRRAEEQGGLRLGDKSRVFKVAKGHVPLAEQPAAVRDMLGYEFYEYDAERGRAQEFSHEVAPQKDPRYWAALNDLAWDIKQALDNLKADAPRPGAQGPEAAPAAAKTVYLATATSDVSAERDLIRRELQQRGYRVLPDRELTLVASDLREEVRAQLAGAALSVHLVGANYGVIPEGEEERSCARLQHELAAERGAADPAFTRLVWMPPGLAPSDARQRRFAEELQSRLGAGAELLQTTVEDLKLRVLEKLNPAPKPAAGAGDDEVKSVYVVCDDQDTEEVAPLEQYLFDEGYEVIPTLPSEDTQQLAQYHRESLVNCDAALVYYGRANQMWLRSKLWDLQKAQGWGREAPMLARAVYVSGPPTGEKARFRTREVPVVIQNFEGFSPDALRPFLRALRREGQP